MNTPRDRRAAEILWEHWRRRTQLDALPDDVRPRTLRRMMVRSLGQTAMTSRAMR